MPRPPVTSREAILEAAIRVAARDGLLAATLDNVAREAGVTKGGVLYHFASKDLLISGAIEHFKQKVESLLVARVADDPEPSRRWLRAMFATAFGDAGDRSDRPRGDAKLPPDGLRKLVMAMMTAAAVNPALLELIRPFIARMVARFESEPDAIDQIVGWLAADGLFLWETLGFARPGDPLWDRIVENLRDKARPHEKNLRAGRRKTKGDAE